MRRYTIALLLGLAALTATLSACGDDDGGGGVASAGGDATESAADGGEELSGFEEALAYSECMRDNGVPDFPDPEENGDGGIRLGMPGDGSLDPESEEFQAAEEACKDLTPGPKEGATIDPEAYEAMVAYSECMRDNGVPEFPDPQEGGGIIMRGGEMGFDPNSEEFKAAQEACEDLRPERAGGPGNDSEGGE
jgi:hypothetical protein